MHCYSNKISQLNIAQCPQLNLLYAQKNRLERLDLSANIALRNLVLANNPLQEIDLSRLHKLEEFTLSSTQLKTLGSLPSLSHLLTLQLAQLSLQAKELNALYTALPNVKGIAITEDEKSWKCILNLRGVPQATQSSTQIAKDKGWNVLQ